jgi:hypothetical protein
MRLLSWSLLALLLFASAAVSAAGAEQHGSYVENPRWGYKVRPPRNWERRAIQLDEAWIADKFFPDRTMRARDGTGEGFVEYKPNVWVIGFPRDRTESGGVHREKVDENTTVITISNPYKHYKDFVERESWASTGSGGWYYAREDEIEHEGYPVSIYEILVEKLVRAPIRIVTWVYHCQDVDFAVQVRILEEHYQANKNVVDGCVKSFREIPRTEPFPEAPEPQGRITMGEKEPETRTVEEIDAERLRTITRRIDREIKHLPKGWSVQKSRHFVCLTQQDKTHTKYVLNFAEELRKYLEKHFSDLGPAEVPPGLIRVFTSAEDERAYTQGTRGWWTDEVGEITMTYGRDASILAEFSSLADRLTDQYFHIKNENLRWGMPGWIRHGIWGHIAWARPSKRKKFILQPSPWDTRELLIMMKEGNPLPLKTLMTTGTSDYEGYAHIAQAKSVVHYLLNRGNKGKTKGVITVYLRSLEQIIREEDKRFEEEQDARWKAEQAARGANPDAGKTEEELEAEEEERFRNRRQKRNEHGERMKSKYDAIRQRALEAAFGHFTDKDWESLDKRWRKFIQN